MRINIATLFKSMCEEVLNTSIIGRARKNNLIDLRVYDIRDYSKNKHRHVDDSPYGGGHGMVMQAQPIYDCCQDIKNSSNEAPFVIFTSAAGKVFNQEIAKELSKKENITIVCGHYEGIDQRIIDEICDMEISIGDFVLTGGELPALVITDAIARLRPNVLKNEEGFTNESHYDGLLEHAQYTRPAVWNNKSVPEVLLSGHEKNIIEFRKQDSINRTKNLRPDLYAKLFNIDNNVEN